MSDEQQSQLSNTHTAVDPNAIPEKEQQQQQQQPIYYGEPTVLAVPATGTLTVGYYEKSTRGRKFANPAPAGLAVLATTLFCLGLILSGAHSVSNPGVLAGAFFFCGGLIMIICGIWSIVVDNVFASVLFLCYGGFFASFGTLVTDVFGVVSAYASDPAELNSALGLYLSGWTVFGFMLWTATFKSTIPIFVLLFCVWFFLLLYTIAVFGAHVGCQTAAGVFSFIASACAFYASYCGLTDAANSYAPVPEYKKLFLMPDSWAREPIDPATTV
ncbi:unnamed protein product [[Candida] boidinii]|uniref:Unnamed protein product n=1 Tax=Candida boidinii TaxID=5477 RepID=A0A9W6T7J2_CANBO|nr:hypothetical protein BVG19_g2516 [[Candida] boidinii]OWB50467.1 hypothetical protein B5S27_g2017 [[Candida] boidinii]OWB66511.1 hypothetical protein B5S30_g1852 [[Candida] boidinii]OWB81773.1 hypothetical protein B5S33_g392 [[Candida] boidinii]GME80502.1 unnamed protein product [[Candida] boidinii]